MKIWLDDVRDPVALGYTGYVWVKSLPQLVVALAYNPKEIEEISFDHWLYWGNSLAGVYRVADMLYDGELNPDIKLYSHSSDSSVINEHNNILSLAEVKKEFKRRDFYE